MRTPHPSGIRPRQRPHRATLAGAMVLTLWCVPQCIQKSSTPESLASQRNRDNEARGQWSEDQIQSVARAAEAPVVNTLISVMNRQLGNESMLSPSRRELMVKSLDRIAGLIEAQKSLVEVSGSKEWLEQSQIERMLQYLPRQKAFQVPDGKGGTTALPLKWGVGLVPAHMQFADHAGFYPVVKKWVQGILARLQSRESEGVFRRIPLRFDPGIIDTAQPGLPTLATSEQVIEEHVKLIEAIDPLEGTEYSFHLEDNLYGKKEHIFIFKKEALFAELIGGERVRSVHGTRYSTNEQKKVVQNAPVTCATTDSDYTLGAARSVFREPVPLIGLLAEGKGRAIYNIGEFKEQQFCIGVIEHMLSVLHSD